jgi:hypothetical protein
MGSWYAIGLVLGLGVGGGVIAAGALARTFPGIVIGGVAAAAIGVALGIVAGGALPPIGGGIGGAAGMLGASQVVRGALRRGGTDAGTAALVGVAGLVLAALALVPAVGYVEGVVVPLLGLRIRRRSAARYAGLRTLAK